VATSPSNVIELNGNMYDTSTGRLVSHAKHPTIQNTAPVAVLDGFVKRKQSPRQMPIKKAVKPQRSQTLMRSAVKKPAPESPQSTTLKPKRPLSLSEQERLSRAAQVKKSGNIKKFHRNERKITGKLENMQVKAGVAQQPNDTPPPIHLNNRTSQRPLKEQFAQLLAQSDAHNMPVIKQSRGMIHGIASRFKVSRRFATTSLVALTAITVVGFGIYSAMPHMSIRVASTKSGLQAKLPSYKPAGFGLYGPIEYQPGEIKVQYRSNSDDRSFSITQKSSDWNSETLLSSYVANEKQNYQTFQDKGRTIYIYEGSNATWVDGGVWYHVEGSSALNSEQLLRIANSL
jgi:hypothetical protein